MKGNPNGQLGRVTKVAYDAHSAGVGARHGPRFEELTSEGEKEKKKRTARRGTTTAHAIVEISTKWLIDS